ncbi:hypothetical protein C8J30_106136 [Rhodobacter viridis]|uniref:Regulator of chromosome condensation (RCC1) repeat-containing protein n=1 Tax=Rhodobacter viridis TaxID=1054202 RepID=A0A318UCK2_9RHOB|nr:hypothetical protein [Rhodobacter viridis]PYF10004.1 hypothetical protein C8J30_106136 [Rhodobacter viridis]
MTRSSSVSAPRRAIAGGRYGRQYRLALGRGWRCAGGRHRRSLDFEAGLDRLFCNFTSIVSVRAQETGFSIALSTGATVFRWGANLYEGQVAVGPEVEGKDKIAGMAMTRTDTLRGRFVVPIG